MSMGDTLTVNTNINIRNCYIIKIEYECYIYIVHSRNFSFFLACLLSFIILQTHISNSTHLVLTIESTHETKRRKDLYFTTLPKHKKF